MCVWMSSCIFINGAHSCRPCQKRVVGQCECVFMLMSGEKEAGSSDFLFIYLFFLCMCLCILFSGSGQTF